MATRSKKNVIGRILEKIGRALSGGASGSRRRRGSHRRSGRSGKGLLRRLLG